MKLRNSFVSIKSIADEFNVPIVEESFSQPNVNIKIDKPSKTGLRVRNLKKSMLNDNRLLKLKDRFIRRSKSTVCDFKRGSEENSNENNQNKENERPIFPSMIDLSVKSPTTTRNKVKMGTRVFSASYLNKSFDSLNENQAELTRVDSWGALCINSPKREAFDETAEDEKEIEISKDKDDAYVIGKPSLVDLGRNHSKLSLSQNPASKALSTETTSQCATRRCRHRCCRSLKTYHVQTTGCCRKFQLSRIRCSRISSISSRSR